MVAIATSLLIASAKVLDEVLYEIGEEVQLSESRYDEADGRYHAVGALFKSGSSPFRHERPAVYPQGSMALGTTVKPVSGPHDLD